MNRCHSFRLTATREEELGRFVEVKKEKAANEHEKRNDSKGDVKVAPTPGLSSVAANLPRRTDIAREYLWVARILGDDYTNPNSVFHFRTKEKGYMVSFTAYARECAREG